MFKGVIKPLSHTLPSYFLTYTIALKRVIFGQAENVIRLMLQVLFKDMLIWAMLKDSWRIGHMIIIFRQDVK